MITAYAVIFCLAFTASVLLAPIVRLVAARIGAVDHPDGVRKVHVRPTPRLGGPLIVLAMLAALAAHAWMAPGNARFLSMGFERTGMVYGFIAGLLIILALGIWDDIKGVKPRTKLAVQTLAVLVCFAAGYRVNVPFLPRGPVTDILSLPVTWFWMVACINAMNLVDGMDGLASGVAFFAGAVIFVLAALFGRLSVAMISVAMIGSVVGFLMYNFHPAVMFLGDSGSLLLGYMIAILAWTGSLKSHATVALLIPVLALGLPIMDTLLAILRRISRRLPVSRADREHIHHKLLAMGFTHREAVVVLYAACLTLAAAALATASASSLVVGLVLGGICVCVMLAVHLVGASEIFAFFRRLGEKMRAHGGERLDSAARGTAFRLKLSRSPDDVGLALEHYLAALGASGARILRPGARPETIVEVTWRPNGAAGRIEEGFTLPSGTRLLLVVEGVDGAALHLPDEVRAALAKVFSDMEADGGGQKGVFAVETGVVSGNLAAP